MCDGPRTSQICILLKYRLLQKSIVRGPLGKVGTANIYFLQHPIFQQDTNPACSRSVAHRAAAGDFDACFSPSLSFRRYAP